MIFSMEKQHIDPVAKNQSHIYVAYMQCFLSTIASGWFLRLHESYKNDWSAFVIAFKKRFFSHKTSFYSQNEA